MFFLHLNKNNLIQHSSIKIWKMCTLNNLFKDIYTGASTIGFQISNSRWKRRKFTMSIYKSGKTKYITVSSRNAPANSRRHWFTDLFLISLSYSFFVCLYWYSIDKINIVDYSDSMVKPRWMKINRYRGFDGVKMAFSFDFRRLH